MNLIKHPGLVEIFEFGLLDNGTAYIIMEFLAGLSLSAYLHRSPAGLGNEALVIGRQIALAMAAAHLKGIVHRDLKPENVMLVPDPERPGERRVKVLDFGIAKLSQQASGPDGKIQTETGTMIGTPAYMAPEQCLADPNLDGKADVYALGIMLYEMLAARLPFTAQHSFDFMAAHVRGNPRPLGEVAPHVPPEVANLVHTMMAKTPPERPSMEAVVGLIDQLRAALPGLWAMPQVSQPFPQVSPEALAMEATALGPTNPSPQPSKELMELGATVPGTPTPSGRRSRDALAPALGSADAFPPGAQARRELATPTPMPADRQAISSVTPLANLADTSHATPPAILASHSAAGTAQNIAPPPRSQAAPWAAALVLLLACGVTAIVVSRLSSLPATPVTAPAPPQRVVRWVVHSVPAGAEVVRADGQIMGTTPWELAQLAGTGETAVRLHRAGFQDKTMVLNHSADVQVELHLDPVPAAPPPIPATVQPTESSPSAKRRKTRVRSAAPNPSGNDVQLLLD